jgi:hypothetical protein
MVVAVGLGSTLAGSRGAAAQAVTARLRTVAPPVDFDTPVASPRAAPKPAAATAPKPTAATAPKPTAATTPKPTAATTPKPAAATAPKPAAAVSPAHAPAPAGGGTAPAKPAAHAAGARPSAEAPSAVPAAAPPRAPGTLAVKGLTGTLNTDDVHQTMQAQKPAFDACIEQGRRSVRWVHGAMRFAFKVDAEGKVLEARPVQSDVGHRGLEQCLTSAVSSVVFPKPAGRARAQFAWAVTVDPAGTPADPLDAKSIAKLVRKQRRAIARSCELRPRERFQLTAYVAQNGKVLSAGGFALRRGGEKIDCVVEAVGELRLPKVTRRSKVSFRL